MLILLNIRRWVMLDYQVILEKTHIQPKYFNVRLGFPFSNPDAIFTT